MDIFGKHHEETLSVGNAKEDRIHIDIEDGKKNVSNKKYYDGDVMGYFSFRVFH